MEIIFGRDFKLEAADPYLFYAYEFRRFCLLAKLIVTVGYSFSDSHINKMLAQAMRVDPDRQLMVVTRCEKKKITHKKTEVAGRLEIAETRIHPQVGSAKSFLESQKLTQTILDLVPKASDSPF